jgi:hypothetical protein
MSTTINDDVFRKELDVSLKRQKIKIRERNNIIKLAFFTDVNDRDKYLEREDMKARQHEAKIKEEKNIPLESSEQKELVAWFRVTYPNKVIAMHRNDGFRQQSEKAEQVLLGLHKGISDLSIPHLHLWVEMKRCKPKDSPWSEEQQEFKRYVEDECGDTYILGYGFEDAKKKILSHTQSQME